MASSALAASAVALVVALTPGGPHTGTSFAVSSDKNSTRLLTAYHVIDGATRIVVFSPDGEGHNATVVVRDRVRDAALLSIDSGGFTTLSLEEPPQAVPGGAITVIGFPGPRQIALLRSDVDIMNEAVPSVAEGSLRGLFQTGESIVFKANIGHGDSGGPVIDTSTGKVIGMTTGTVRTQGTLFMFNGMDFGLSAPGLAAIVHPAMPIGGAHMPQYVISIVRDPPDAENATLTSYVQSQVVDDFAQQLDFIAVDGSNVKNPDAACASSPASGVARVRASSTGAQFTLQLTVTDCIGDEFFSDSQTLSADDATEASIHRVALFMTGQLEREFDGTTDTQRAAWLSLLQYGFAIAPDDRHYYSLIRRGTNNDDAATIEAVMPRGPAATAGLRAGDKIVRIENRDTAKMTSDAIAAAIDKPKVQLVIVRSKSQKSIVLRPLRYDDLVKLTGSSH
jgi:S1-C subfamily serine protease